MAEHLDGIRKHLEGLYAADVLGILNKELLGRFLAPSRKGHFEPAAEQEAQEFAAWKAQYDRVLTIGFEKGWLVGGYEPDEVSEPHGPWVWDETEEEYAARVPKIEGPITFPVKDGS